MQYRRLKAAGGTYFFTVNLANRSSSLLVEHVAELRQAVRTVKQSHPFDILAWAVLSEHMHAVWTLPPDDDEFSKRWRLIKARFFPEPSNETKLSAHLAEKKRARHLAAAFLGASDPR